MESEHLQRKKTFDLRLVISEYWISYKNCVGVCVSFVQVQHKGASLHFAESSYKLWRPLHSPILQRFVQRGCINVFWQGHYEYFRYLGPAVTRGWYCCVDGVVSSRRFKSCEEFRVTLQCWETTIFTFKGKAVMSVMALKAIYWFLIQ